MQLEAVGHHFYNRYLHAQGQPQLPQVLRARQCFRCLEGQPGGNPTRQALQQTAIGVAQRCTGDVEVPGDALDWQPCMHPPSECILQVMKTA
eukprot:5029337-Lingulodinium_polyedra.AAC.1